MSVSGQQPSHWHRRGSTFGRSVLVTHLAVLTSKVMHMLRFSAPKPTVEMCCCGGANVMAAVH
eukprot:scaffold70709_cov62-Cyclotella_meneghiniana.AAC.1